jgi:hypothetical protein
VLYGSNAVDTKNVKRDEQPRHHCVAEMYGVAMISPENIAYAAVVVSVRPHNCNIRSLNRTQLGEALPIIKANMEYDRRQIRLFNLLPTDCIKTCGPRGSVGQRHHRLVEHVCNTSNLRMVI